MFTSPRSLPCGGHIVALAANARSVGAAVVSHQGPIHWRVARLRRSRAGPRDPEIAVARLIAALCTKYRPCALVAFLDDEPDFRRRRGSHITSVIVEPAAKRTKLPVLRVRRSQVSRALGISRGTNLLLRREMMRRYPTLARVADGMRRDQEAERYWEAAAVASAAGETLLADARIVHA